MTYQELIKKVCNLEGKKVQVSIGNVKEVVKSLKRLCKDKEVLEYLLSYLKKGN